MKAPHRWKFEVPLILIGAVCFGQTPSVNTSTVEFVVSDYFGKELQYRMDEFRDTKSNADFAATFSGLRGMGIPYARYYYRLVARGTSPGVPLEGEVSLQYPEQLLTLTPNAAAIVFPNGNIAEPTRSLPSRVIRGIVSPKPQGSMRTWVVFQALYSPYNAQYKASIEPSGEFRIYAPLWGSYILSVLRAGEVLHVEVVSFGSPLERSNRSLESSLVIKLDPKPLPVTHVP